MVTNAPGTWSVTVRRLTPDPAPLFEHQPDLPLRTASSAKVNVLYATATAVAAGEAALHEPVSRDTVEPVHDSGLWQHLTQDSLPLADAAKLVGAYSDNWATNALITRLGGVGVANAGAALLGVHDVALHDIVRDQRAPEHPSTLSTGSSSGYATVFARLWERADQGEWAAQATLGWLRGGADLSMVASVFGLDPLCHTHPDRGVEVVTKTGTDHGVRADSGLVIAGDTVIAYSALANWEPDEQDTERDEVLAAMKRIGGRIRDIIAT